MSELSAPIVHMPGTLAALMRGADLDVAGADFGPLSVFVEMPRYR